MPRQVFDRKLRRLQDELLLLTSMVETALLESVDILNLERTADRVCNICERTVFAVSGEALVLNMQP